MSSYDVVSGDTFEDISRKRFGSVNKAATLIAANPGSSNPPVVGTDLFVPDQETPIAPPDAQDGQVSVTIGGERFIGWDDIQFTRSMDSFGAFRLRSVWEPQNQVFREVFKPFSYQTVAFFEGGELLFNGTMIDISPNLEPTRRTIDAAGYSAPGVLNDCTPPISSLPLEGDKQDLNQIAATLLDPFGIGLNFDGDPGPAFDREAIEPNGKILAYLIKLSKQRGLIITDTPEGNCRFYTETGSEPLVATIEDGDEGILAIRPMFNTQNYFSHISGQGSTFFSLVGADPGSAYTVVNPRLSGVLRPHTFTPDDTLYGDTKSAVEAKSGRMFSEAVAYSLQVIGWNDPDGKLWSPGTRIKITAPGAMIYEPYEFLIRAVQYQATATKRLATLTLVPPGVFRGQIPERMPWET